MSSKSRAERRRAQARRSGTSGSKVFVISAVALAAVFVVAVALSRSGDESGGNGEERQTAPVEVNGEALPDFESSADDPAVGQAMPEFEGVSFDGDPVSITNDGQAKMIMFLAHWCPHCQAEVPIVQEWLDAGGNTEQIDVYAVSTAVDQTRPNYPPSAWLEREGWSPTVLVDDEGSSAGSAAGLTSYPYFVFVDSEGNVTGRAAGRLPIEQIEAFIAATV